MTTTVLGFDFGTQKIGVAVGQSLTGSATPLTALTCPQQAIPWQAIVTLLGEWQPTLLVVGLPLNMDDSESTLSQRARRFARQLEGRYQLPVALIDERLSTREARARTGIQKADPKVDSMAAAILIENFFNG